MNENVKFSARLNEVCDDMKIPPKGKNRQTLLGKRFGVSQEAARKWLEGESIPKQINVIAIAHGAGVCSEWLWSGRGPKFLAARQDPAVAEVNKLMEPMSETRKYDVVRIVKAIAEGDEPKGQR